MSELIHSRQIDTAGRSYLANWLDNSKVSPHYIYIGTDIPTRIRIPIPIPILYRWCYICLSSFLYSTLLYFFFATFSPLFSSIILRLLWRIRSLFSILFYCCLLYSTVISSSLLYSCLLPSCQISF